MLTCGPPARACGRVRLRVVVGVLFGCLAVAGCGSETEDDAASRDTVQTAVARSQAPAPSPSADHAREGAAGVLHGTFTRLDGEREALGSYRGSVVLVVNTATACGYTPQFAGLEALYRAHRDEGLVVLGFPANDFGGQEPRSNTEIAEFCKDNYGVTFPMFAKTTVTGERAHPLFRRLSAAAGEPVWNFNKYLVDRRGKVVARFGAGIEPDDPELTRRLEQLL